MPGGRDWRKNPGRGGARAGSDATNDQQPAAGSAATPSTPSTASMIPRRQQFNILESSQHAHGATRQQKPRTPNSRLPDYRPQFGMPTPTGPRYNNNRGYQNRSQRPAQHQQSPQHRGLPLNAQPTTPGAASQASNFTLPPRAVQPGAAAAPLSHYIAAPSANVPAARPVSSSQGPPTPSLLPHQAQGPGNARLIEVAAAAPKPTRKKWTQIYTARAPTPPKASEEAGPASPPKPYLLANESAEGALGAAAWNNISAIAAQRQGAGGFGTGSEPSRGSPSKASRSARTFARVRPENDDEEDAAADEPSDVFVEEQKLPDVASESAFPVLPPAASPTFEPKRPSISFPLEKNKVAAPAAAVVAPASSGSTSPPPTSPARRAQSSSPRRRSSSSRRRAPRRSSAQAASVVRAVPSPSTSHARPSTPRPLSPRPASSPRSPSKESPRQGRQSQRSPSIISENSFGILATLAEKQDVAAPLVFTPSATASAPSFPQTPWSQSPTKQEKSGKTTAVPPVAARTPVTTTEQKSTHHIKGKTPERSGSSPTSSRAQVPSTPLPKHATASRITLPASPGTTSVAAASSLPASPQKPAKAQRSAARRAKHEQSPHRRGAAREDGLDEVEPTSPSPAIALLGSPAPKLKPKPISLAPPDAPKGPKKRTAIAPPKVPPKVKWSSPFRALTTPEWSALKSETRQLIDSEHDLAVGVSVPELSDLDDKRLQGELVPVLDRHEGHSHNATRNGDRVPTMKEELMLHTMDDRIIETLCNFHEWENIDDRRSATDSRRLHVGDIYLPVAFGKPAGWNKKEWASHKSQVNGIQRTGGNVQVIMANLAQRRFKDRLFWKGLLPFDTIEWTAEERDHIARHVPAVFIEAWKQRHELAPETQSATVEGDDSAGPDLGSLDGGKGEVAAVAEDIIGGVGERAVAEKQTQPEGDDSELAKLKARIVELEAAAGLEDKVDRLEAELDGERRATAVLETDIERLNEAAQKSVREASSQIANLESMKTSLSVASRDRDTAQAEQAESARIVKRLTRDYEQNRATIKHHEDSLQAAGADIKKLREEKAKLNRKIEELKLNNRGDFARLEHFGKDNVSDWSSTAPVQEKVDRVARHAMDLATKLHAANTTIAKQKKEHKAEDDALLKSMDERNGTIADLEKHRDDLISQLESSDKQCKQYVRSYSDLQEALGREAVLSQRETSYGISLRDGIAAVAEGESQDTEALIEATIRKYQSLQEVNREQQATIERLQRASSVPAEPEVLASPLSDHFPEAASDSESDNEGTDEDGDAETLLSVGSSSQNPPVRVELSELSVKVEAASSGTQTEPVEFVVRVELASSATQPLPEPVASPVVAPSLVVAPSPVPASTSSMATRTTADNADAGVQFELPVVPVMVPGFTSQPVRVPGLVGPWVEPRRWLLLVLPALLFLLGVVLSVFALLAAASSAAERQIWTDANAYTVWYYHYTKWLYPMTVQNMWTGGFV